MVGRATWVSRVRFALVVVMATLALPAEGNAAKQKDVEPAQPTSISQPPDSSASRLTDLILSSGGLGAYPDDDGTIVVVVPASRAAAFPLADASQLGIPIRVETRPIDGNRVQELKQLVREFAAAQPYATETFGMSFDPKLGQLVVQGTASPDVFSPLVTEYAGEIIYRQGAGGAQSRHADIPPFWGGAEVKRPSDTTPCTTGFTVKSTSSGYRYMVTAGHCFEYWDEVFSPGNGERIGRVTRTASWPQRDMLLIGGESYGKAIYRGPEGSSAFGYVLGASNFVLGYTNYCRSGVMTFEACGYHVEDLSASMCYFSICTNGVASLSGGTACAIPGDSGAPWFLQASGSSDVYIRGLHIGAFCPTHYAEKYNKIANVFDVEIHTGS